MIYTVFTKSVRKIFDKRYQDVDIEVIIRWKN